MKMMMQMMKKTQPEEFDLSDDDVEEPELPKRE